MAGKKPPKAKPRLLEDVEGTEPSEVDPPRDLINDPMFLRDLLHRFADILPKDLGDVIDKDVDDEEADAVLNDISFVFDIEEKRGYLIPSAEEEGPEDEEEDEEEEGEAEDDDEEEEDEEEEEEEASTPAPKKRGR